MKIDQQIYDLLLDNAGGQISKIKGVSAPTLREMRKGSGKTTFSTMFEVFKENGIKAVTLSSEYTSMHIDMENRSVKVQTKKITKL